MVHEESLKELYIGSNLRETTLVRTLDCFDYI